MLAALIILNAVHPGKVLKGPESSFPGTWRRRRQAKLGDASEYRSLDPSDVELVSRQEQRV